jgi:hypothetical protein
MMIIWSDPSAHPYLTISALRLCVKSVKSAESVSKESNDPEEERIFRDLWEDETEREVVIFCLKADSAR